MAYRQHSREGTVERVVRTHLIQNGSYFDPQSVVVGEGENVLSRSEKFSLDLMLKRGFISREQYDFFAGVGKLLDPEQIQFYEFNRWYSAVNAAHELGEIPKENVTEWGLGENGMLLSIRRGFFWSVSGQVLDPLYRPGAGRKWVRKKLAVELGPRFGELRDWPFPEDAFLFEWGRAGKEKPEREALPRMAQVALIHNINEVLALGGDPEKAWVIVGASDQAHLKAYRDGYGFEEFGHVEGNIYLRRKLTDLIVDARLAPRLSSKKVARLAELSREARGVPDVKDLDLIQFLGQVNASMKTPLDLEARASAADRRSPPVWLQDRSPIFLTIAMHNMEKVGLVPVRGKVSAVLNQQKSVRLPPPELARELAEPSMWDRRSAVYLGGLEEWCSANPAENPLYPVVAAYRYFARHLATLAPSALPPAEAARQAARTLEVNGVRFDFFVRDEALMKKFTALGVPVEPAEIGIGFQGDVTQLEHDRIQLVKSPGWRVELSAGEITGLERRFFPGDTAEIAKAAQEGYWKALLGLHEDLSL